MIDAQSRDVYYNWHAMTDSKTSWRDCHMYISAAVLENGVQHTSNITSLPLT
jgi:hypothetical protein